MAQNNFIVDGSNTGVPFLVTPQTRSLSTAVLESSNIWDHISYEPSLVLDARPRISPPLMDNNDPSATSTDLNSCCQDQDQVLTPIGHGYTGPVHNPGPDLSLGHLPKYHIKDGSEERDSKTQAKAANRASVVPVHTVPSIIHRLHALQACEKCRAKKSRCDEGRPVCSNCKQSQVLCRYRDDRPIRQVIPTRPVTVEADEGQM